MNGAFRTAAKIACVIGLTMTSANVRAMPSSFTKGPYLQELAPTSVTIRVELETPDAVALEVVKEGEPARTLTDSNVAAFHSVRVDGLKPQTRYEYVVHAGGLSGAAAKGEFQTAPPDESSAPFTFLIYGDNRDDEAAHALVVRAMAEHPAEFLLHTGDFVQAGGDPRHWAAFFRIESGFLRSRCVFACVGNHELNEDRAAVAYARYFGPSDPSGRLYSTFRWANTRFFLLNAFHDWSGGEERAWLEKALSDSQNERGIYWRVAVVHHGPWSAGPHGRSPTLSAAGVPGLLAKYRIDLVVSGHDHIYERGEENGTRYLVSGGGGAPLYRNIQPLASTRKAEAAFHFIEVKVTPDAIKTTALRPDGSVLDKCGFSKRPGWDCDALAAVHAMPAASAAPGGSAASLPVAPAAPPPDAQASKCGCRAPGMRARAPETAFGAGAIAAAIVVLRARRKKR